MYAFVLGTGRCGSTLVHDVVARHPDVGFVSNVDDLLARLDLTGRWNSLLYRHIPVRFTEKGRVRLAPSEAYRILDRQVSQAVSMPYRDLEAADATPWLAGRFRSFFERRRVAQAKPVFLHKFTGWPRTGFVREVFPDARFVHVVRDGRAVANSWLQMDWWLGYRGPQQWHWGPLPARYEEMWEASGRSHVVLAGLAWCLLMDSYERARALVPPEQWLEIRYEDLLARPEASFTQVLAFLGMELNAAFRRGLDLYTFRTTRSDAFRRDLSPADVDSLTKCLGPHLDSKGYDP